MKKYSAKTIFPIGASAGYSFAYFGTKGMLKDYLDCVARIGKLGINLYQIEILVPGQAAMFVPQKRKEWADTALKANVKYSDFNCFAAGKDLAALDPAANRRGVKLVKFAVETAKELGIPMLTLAGDWPPELIKTYRPEYFNSPPAEVAWREGLSWKRYWRQYADNIKRCFGIAKRAGMILAFEPRANTVVGNLDAFLRLADDIKDDDFGCELDVMHVVYCNEDLATTIRRAGRTLKQIQVCDADGRTMHHRALGDGKVDFAAMLDALRDIGYTGILQLEIYGKTLKGKIDESHVAGKKRLEILLKPPAHHAESVVNRRLARHFAGFALHRR